MEGFAYALIDNKTMTVYVVKNSKAEKFARKHKIPFVSNFVAHLDDLEFPENGDYESSNLFADTIGSLLG